MTNETDAMAISASRAVAQSIEVIRPTLDDVFLTMTGRSLRDAEQDAPDEESGSEA